MRALSCFLALFALACSSSPSDSGTTAAASSSTDASSSSGAGGSASSSASTGGASSSSSAGGAGGAGGGTSSGLPIDCSLAANLLSDVCTIGEPPMGTIGKGPGLNDFTLGDYGFGFVEGKSAIVTVTELAPNNPDAYVISVDLTTGDRTLLTGRWSDPKNGPTTKGSGPDIGDHGDVVRGLDGKLRVWSDTKQLLVVDPATGDRTVEYDEAVAPCLYNGNGIAADTISGIEVDEKGGVYVAAQGFNENFIEYLSGAPVACSLVATSGDGNGVDFLEWVGISYRQGKLYGLWYTDQSLLEYDAAKMKRTRVSSTGSSTIGKGPAFGAQSSYVATTGDVWVAGGYLDITDVATKVDPASGDRTGYAGKAGPLESPMGAYYPNVLGEYGGFLVLTNAGSIDLFDPKTGNSNRVSR